MSWNNIRCFFTLPQSYVNIPVTDRNTDTNKWVDIMLQVNWCLLSRHGVTEFNVFSWFQTLSTLKPPKPAEVTASVWPDGLQCDQFVSLSGTSQTSQLFVWCGSIQMCDNLNLILRLRNKPAALLSGCLLWKCLKWLLYIIIILWDPKSRFLKIFKILFIHFNFFRFKML